MVFELRSGQGFVTGYGHQWQKDYGSPSGEDIIFLKKIVSAL